MFFLSLWLHGRRSWENDKTQTFLQNYDAPFDLLEKLYFERGTLVRTKEGIWYHFPQSHIVTSSNLNSNLKECTQWTHYSFWGNELNEPFTS